MSLSYAKICPGWLHCNQVFVIWLYLIQAVFLMVCVKVTFNNSDKMGIFSREGVKQRWVNNDDLSVILSIRANIRTTCRMEYRKLVCAFRLKTCRNTCSF